MSATLLLKEFTRLSDAPGAMQHFRNCVRQLGVNGSILETDRSSWSERSLGELGTWGSGGTPNKAHAEYYGGEIPWLVIGDLNDGLITAVESTITAQGLANSSAKIVEPGTLLVAMYGSIGKLGLAGIRCATNQAIAHCVVNPDLVTPEYFMLALRSMRGALLARGQGGTQANISQTILKSWPITLPPVDEQPQIVAKVDELMSLCDQVEAAQKERDLHRTALRAVSLHRLPATPAEGDTSENINFFLKRSKRLITLPEHVAEVRQCILELAVRGRLVASDAWVGPTIASASPISDAIVTTDLFDIPRRWHWGTLASVSTRIHYGYTASADLSTRDIRLLRITDIQNGRVNWESVPGCVISEEEAAKFLLSEGDILIARTGGTMGKSFLVTAAPVRAVFASYLIRVQPSTKVDRRYLKLFLESPLYWQQLSAASRGTGQPNVNGKTLGGLVIPFPPLDEQSRIVETVDSLISLCGGLEEALTSAHFERERLLEALLRDALSGGGAPPELDEAVLATA